MSAENKEYLEELEDLILSLIAASRDTQDAKKISHEDVWKNDKQPHIKKCDYSIFQE